MRIVLIGAVLALALGGATGVGLNGPATASVAPRGPQTVVEKAGEAVAVHVSPQSPWRAASSHA